MVFTGNGIMVLFTCNVVAIVDFIACCMVVNRLVCLTEPIRNEYISISNVHHLLQHHLRIATTLNCLIQKAENVKCQHWLSVVVDMNQWTHVSYIALTLRYLLYQRLVSILHSF
jgi:hypothetical protein